MHKNFYSVFYFGLLLLLSSCDTGVDLTEQNTPPGPRTMDWKIISTQDYKLSDLGDYKDSAKSCYAQSQSLIGINNLNDDGVMTGYLWQMKDDNKTCDTLPFASTTNGSSFQNYVYKTYKTLDTRNPEQEAYGYEVEGVTNKDAQNHFSMFSSFLWATDTGANTNTINIGLIKGYAPGVDKSDLSEFTNVEVLKDHTYKDKDYFAGIIPSKIMPSPDGTYLFTTPTTYQDILKDGMKFLTSQILKYDQGSLSVIQLQYDSDYYGDGDRNFKGTVLNIGNNGNAVAFDVNPIKVAGKYMFVSPAICKEDDSTTHQESCHIMVDYHVSEMERALFAQVSPNGKNIYALKRTSNDMKSIPTEMMAIDPDSYKETKLPLNYVTGILGVFDNGDAIVGDSTMQIYYYSKAQAVLEPLPNLLKAANVSNYKDYGVEAVSFNGQYILFYNKKINDKSSDDILIYKLVHIKP